MTHHFLQAVLEIISFLFDVITFPVYFVLQQPWKQRQLSKRKRATQVSGDDSQVTYRSVTPVKDLHLNLIRENIDTLVKVFSHAANIHKSKDCLGTREILSEIDEVQPNGKVFKKYKMGEYKWQTFTEVERAATNFGRGLRELGLEPLHNVAIFAETRAEWMIAAHGCFKQNFPIVSIYATLGDDGIIYGVTETEATVIITTNDLLPKFKKLLDLLPNVKAIVYMEDQLKKTNTDGFKEGVSILSFSEVVKIGETSKAVASPPKPDDICIIMYTSGSTGDPKGVMLSHKSCLATIRAYSDVIEGRPNDVTLGFLPLAHALELLVENATLLKGVPVGYSTPNTILNNSIKIQRGCKGDASVLKPTAMCAVPLILDRISKGITDKVNAASPFQRAVFDFAFEYKKKWTRRGYKTPLLDKLIFKDRLIFKATQVSSDDNQVTYRSAMPHGELYYKLVHAGVDTLEKALYHATLNNALKNCLSTREILSEIDEAQPNGKVFKKYEMGEYKWLTYSAVSIKAIDFGRGLRELGLETLQNVAIFAETRAEWMIAAHGCFKQNFPLVTIYATLGDEGVTHAVSETESTVIITSHELLPKFKKLLDQLPNVKAVIYMEDQLQKTNTDGFKEGVQIMSFNEVIALGKDSKAVASPPKPDDVAIIMYTSGSTGVPKGVLLTHKNCMATLKGFADLVEVKENDVLIGFLPLAHVFELLVENLSLLAGAPIGYSSPNTLIDSSTKTMKGSKGDASVLKPTVMTAVPLILDRIAKGIDEKVSKGSFASRKLFNIAYDRRKATMNMRMKPLHMDTYQSE